MEKKILVLLLEMNSEMKDMKTEIQGMKNEMQDMRTDFNLRLNKLEFKMEDGFETLELKIDKVDLRLRENNKKLSDQIAANMESIENLKN